MNVHLRAGASAVGSGGMVPESPGVAVATARGTRWKNCKTTVIGVTEVNQKRKDAPADVAGVSAIISEREGIRTPGLQLRRLPPYPD